jgi:hypothetical protein
MAYWKSTKKQRGRVKAHEAKDDGRAARRAEDRDEVKDGLVEALNGRLVNDDGWSDRWYKYDMSDDEWYGGMD